MHLEICGSIITLDTSQYLAITIVLFNSLKAFHSNLRSTECTAQCVPLRMRRGCSWISNCLSIALETKSFYSRRASFLWKIAFVKSSVVSQHVFPSLESVTCRGAKGNSVFCSSYKPDLKTSKPSEAFWNAYCVCSRLLFSGEGYASMMSALGVGYLPTK